MEILNTETKRVVDEMYKLCKQPADGKVIGIDRCTIELIVDFTVSNIKGNEVK